VLLAKMRDRSVIAGSASKAYAMTGWRCGWTIAPPEVIDACSAIQSHSTSNASSITQRATLAALTGPQQCVSAMLEEYRRRRDLVYGLLTGDGRMRCVKPAGAFYLFPDVSDLLSPDGMRTSADLAQLLLDEARVAVTAGEAFDAPGFLRVSYATSEERLREGAARIQRFVQALDGGEIAALARR
jgi:aspartate aminotransferase